MKVYEHVLTDLEVECGVTLEQVQYYLPRGAFIDNGTAWVSDAPGPALAGSVARCAFGRPATYTGQNLLGQAVYRAAE